jgi:hypothetical protein
MYPSLFAGLREEKMDFRNKRFQGYWNKNNQIGNSYDNLSQMQMNQYDKQQKQGLLSKLSQGMGFASQVIGMAGGLPI